MTNVISRCNQKRGTGKIATCANLGIGLAMEKAGQIHLRFDLLFNK